MNDTAKVVLGWVVMLIMAGGGYLGYRLADGGILGTVIGIILGFFFTRVAIIFLFAPRYSREGVAAYVALIYWVDAAFLIGTLGFWKRIEQNSGLYAAGFILASILGLLTVLGNIALTRLKRSNQPE
jgi:hypothetical protein